MIAIDARYVRERPSGIGAMVDALVRLVPPMMLDQTFLLLRHPLARQRLSDSPNVREVTLQAEANGPGTLWMLPRLVDLQSVRLFHAPANILPAGLCMPTVTTVHDLMWVMHPELCRVRGAWGHVETMFYRDGIRRALRRSTRIVAISQATLADIRAVSPQAAQRTSVVAHGIDPVFSPSSCEEDRIECDRVRSKYAPGASRHVLAVGRSAPYKNHRKVVEGFLLAFGEDPSTHLVLIQRLGTEAQGLLELGRALGADGRVHVLPSLALPELIALYRGALCLCQPSIMEGWGMPVGEALACGCPVVASRCAALREVLGEAAEYVEPHSTVSIAGGMRRISRESGLRGRLVDAGLRRAREFTWQQHARAMVQIYRECLDQPATLASNG